MADLILILTTMPDDDRVQALATTLVDEGLAACVNVHAAMVSTYRWKGQIEREAERQVVIKTTRDRVHALQTRLPSPTALSSRDDGAGFEFTFEDGEEGEAGSGTASSAHEGYSMGLEFLSSREVIEEGDRALIMPGGPGLHGGERGEKGVASLEGYVGEVIEVMG